MIGCARSGKFRCDFMARTCALILLVQPALHRVSCCNETIQNAPKHYKMHKHMSLGSNGVDQVRLLPKIPMRVRGMKFCVYASVQPVWQRVSCSNEKNPKCTQILQNIDKCTQPLRNAPKHEFRVQWGGSRAFVAKNSDASSWHELLH